MPKYLRLVVIRFPISIRLPSITSPERILAGNFPNADNVWQNNFAIHFIFCRFEPNYSIFCLECAFGAEAVEINKLLIYNIFITVKNTEIKEAKQMTKIKSMYYSLAAFSALLLNLVMILCANTNSCAMVYQPEAPKALDRYSKIK